MFVPQVFFDPDVAYDSRGTFDAHGNVSGWMERSEEPRKPIGFRVRPPEPEPPTPDWLLF